MNESNLRIRKLEEEKQIAGKENISQNSQKSNSVVENSNTVSYEDLARKYDMAKRLCNLRNDSIEKLQKQLADKQQMEEYIQQLQNKIAVDTEEFIVMKAKYENAKEICDLRKKKLKELRVKYGEPDPSAAKEDDAY